VADLIQDARYALQTLTQNPGFAATALLTIALAIGASTAMFTIANGVLFRALPYSDPDRLVRLYSVDRAEPLERGSMSLPDLEDWQSRTGAFSGTAGYVVLPQVLLGRGDPQELPTAYVTEGFFDVLGAQMALGRALDETDVRIASHNVDQHRSRRPAFGDTQTSSGPLQGELTRSSASPPPSCLPRRISRCTPQIVHRSRDRPALAPRQS
jgi:hypothetical protein